MLPSRPSVRLLVPACAVIVLTAVSGPVAGQTAEPDSAEPRVAWSPQWRRFRPWEYVVSAAAGAGAIAIHYGDPPPANPLWHGDNPFDDAVRGALRADTRDGRDRANTVSNVLWLGGGVAPFVVDLPVVLLVHRQPDVAGQLLLMDLEATAISQLINDGLLFETGRARPSYQSCLADPAYGSLCGKPENNISFPSGHVMTIATSAGLTCVHHHYLPIYGDAVADAGACVFMSVATLATGVARIMADNHRASDVLVGATLGFSIGYGVPWFLHYRVRAGSGDTDRAGVALVPFGAPGALGVGLLGLL